MLCSKGASCFQILTIGLLVQLVSFGFFIVLYLRFLFGVRSTRPDLWNRDSMGPFMKDWRAISAALTISCFTIMVRYLLPCNLPSVAALLTILISSDPCIVSLNSPKGSKAPSQQTRASFTCSILFPCLLPSQYMYQHGLLVLFQRSRRALQLAMVTSLALRKEAVDLTCV